MFINEVIRRVDSLYPNEYTIKEKYNWCDDLGAMLCQEYLRRYVKVKLEKSVEGEYLLPEGVTFEMIEVIIAGHNVIEKRDFKSYGIRFFHGINGKFITPTRSLPTDDIEVVFIKRYEPIRDTVIEGNIEFDIKPKPENGGYCTVKYTGERLEAGDTVNMTAVDKSISVVEEATGERTYVTNSVKGVPIIKTGRDGEKFILYVPAGSTTDLAPSNSYGIYGLIAEGTIKRVVTEETVCDAPYDLMYVDYLLAQIFYYQRNYTSYNQHMNLFNQRLEAYERWLQKRRTQEKDNRIYNWW